MNIFDVISQCTEEAMHKLMEVQAEAGREAAELIKTVIADKLGQQQEGDAENE